MRTTWHRQKTDPDYDTPVPEPSNKVVNNDKDLANSVGNLVNKEFLDA